MLPYTCITLLRFSSFAFPLGGGEFTHCQTCGPFRSIADSEQHINQLDVWRISGVDGQVINNQGYQSHWGCQSYLTRDTRG